MGERIAKASKAFGALREAGLQGQSPVSEDQEEDVQGCSSHSASVWLRNLDNQEGCCPEIGSLPPRMPEGNP